MSDYIKRGVRGYLTVEASLIMPIVIFLIALILSLAFFLYSRCIISQDAYILAFRGSLRQENGAEEIRKYIEEDFNNDFQRRYFSISGLKKNIEISNKKVTVRINANSSNKWSIDAVGEAERANPVNNIRKMRLIKKIKEKMQNIDRD